MNKHKPIRRNQNRSTTVIDKTDKTTELMGTKAEIVELWRTTHGHISNLCKAAGISRQTYYEWVKEDKVFALAIENAESELNDDMRESLIDKAAGGELPAITYYLDRKHPEFKRQGQTIAVQVNNYGELANEQKRKYDI